MKITQIAFLVLSLVVFGALTVEAAPEVTISMVTSKLSKHSSGDTYAVNQPLIRVMASPGSESYDIIDLGKPLTFSVQTSYDTGQNWYIDSGGSITLYGKESSQKTGSKGLGGHSYEVQYIPPESAIAPIDLCNNQLKAKGKQLLESGFVVKVPGAYSAHYVVWFKQKVGNKEGAVSDTVLIPAWVLCEEAKMAKKDVDEPPKGAEKKPARMKKFLLGSTLTAMPPMYKGPCPAKLSFTATFKVSMPGKIEYAWLEKDGSKGPSGTLTFDGPGTKQTLWSWAAVTPPPKPGSLTAAQAMPPVLYGTAKILFSTSEDPKTKTLKQVGYSVECTNPPLEPAGVDPVPTAPPIRVPPAKPQRGLPVRQ